MDFGVDCGFLLLLFPLEFSNSQSDLLLYGSLNPLLFSQFSLSDGSLPLLLELDLRLFLRLLCHLLRLSSGSLDLVFELFGSGSLVFDSVLEGSAHFGLVCLEQLHSLLISPLCRLRSSLVCIDFVLNRFHALCVSQVIFLLLCLQLFNFSLMFSLSSSFCSLLCSFLISFLFCLSSLSNSIRLLFRFLGSLLIGLKNVFLFLLEFFLGGLDRSFSCFIGSLCLFFSSLSFNLSLFLRCPCRFLISISLELGEVLVNEGLVVGHVNVAEAVLVNAGVRVETERLHAAVHRALRLADLLHEVRIG